mgnify:CR=1 FL=1
MESTKGGGAAMQWEKLSETIQIAINDAHRFGTDAFLLEHFAAVRGIDTVCDLCLSLIHI